jgi:hypothetical protein
VKPKSNIRKQFSASTGRFFYFLTITTAALRQTATALARSEQVEEYFVAFSGEAPNNPKERLGPNQKN